MNFIFIIQTALYYLIALFGFFVSIPIAVTVNNFNGGCVLYGEIQWKRSNYFVFRTGADSVCEFNIYLHVGIAILFSLFVGSIQVFLIVKERRNERMEIPKIVKLVLVITTGVFAFLTLVSAGLISAGFSQWCNHIMDARDHYVPIRTCSDGQTFQWPSGIYGGSFHICLTLAVVSAWILFVLWLVQFGLGLLRLIKGLE